MPQPLDTTDLELMYQITDPNRYTPLIRQFRRELGLDTDYDGIWREFIDHYFPHIMKDHFFSQSTLKETILTYLHTFPQQWEKTVPCFQLVDPFNLKDILCHVDPHFRWLIYNKLDFNQMKDMQLQWWLLQDPSYHFFADVLQFDPVEYGTISDTLKAEAMIDIRLERYISGFSLSSFCHLSRALHLLDQFDREDLSDHLINSHLDHDQISDIVSLPEMTCVVDLLQLIVNRDEAIDPQIWRTIGSKFSTMLDTDLTPNFSLSDLQYLVLFRFVTVLIHRDVQMILAHNQQSRYFWEVCFFIWDQTFDLTYLDQFDYLREFNQIYARYKHLIKAGPSPRMPQDFGQIITLMKKEGMDHFWSLILIRSMLEYAKTAGFLKEIISLEEYDQWLEDNIDQIGYDEEYHNGH